MPLDPQAKAVLDELEAMGGPPVQEMTVPQARQRARQIARFYGEPEPIARVQNVMIPGPGGSLALRLYYPEGSGPHPATLYFHGGGWTVCDLDTHDNFCRRLAVQARSLVVGVDYRLAPEHKFPAAVEDAYAATAWVLKHAGEINADPTRIAVAGDSAGGNLSTVVCLLARDQGGPALCYQVLVYPVTDYHQPGTDSYRENAEGYFLTRDFMGWFFDHYLAKPEDRQNPQACPLQAADLSGLPPALVITAEYDPLRDEGEAYARRLEEAGVPTALQRFDGMIHGFFGMPGRMDKGAEAVALAARKLREAFGTA